MTVLLPSFRPASRPPERVSRVEPAGPAAVTASSLGGLAKQGRGGQGAEEEVADLECAPVSARGPEVGAARHGTPAVSVEDLVVELGLERIRVLDGVSLTIPRGQVTAIVGESGSGKSVLVKTLLGILSIAPGPVSGRVLWHRLPDPPLVLEARQSNAPASPWIRRVGPELKDLWGRFFGYVGQHGSLALDPTRPVGASLEEAFALSGVPGGRLRWRSEARSLLGRLRLERPEQVLSLYPVQLSGGMAQRVVMALALARGARTLFADEPTTGLDPDAQDVLLRLMLRLHREGLLETLVLVTHDLTLVRQLAQHVIVMAKGKVVEVGPAAEVLEGGAKAPYSRQLLNACDALSRPVVRRLYRAERACLEVSDIRKAFVRRRWGIPIARDLVLKNVSFSVYEGEVVGLVGSSGTGKTTLAQIVARLLPPDEGSVVLSGQNLLELRGGALRRHRVHFQVLFQSVQASVHPRMGLEDALKETARHLLRQSEAEAERSVGGVLERLQLTHRRQSLPGQLSGGELRRAGLARVLLLRPRLLIADEPTAGVDASMRVEILHELLALSAEPPGTAILLISHDRQVIHHAAHRVLALNEGEVYEVSAREVATWHLGGSLSQREEDV